MGTPGTHGNADNAGERRGRRTVIGEKRGKRYAPAESSRLVRRSPEGEGGRDLMKVEAQYPPRRTGK